MRVPGHVMLLSPQSAGTKQRRKQLRAHGREPLRAPGAPFTLTMHGTMQFSGAYPVQLALADARARRKARSGSRPTRYRSWIEQLPGSFRSGGRVGYKYEIRHVEDPAETSLSVLRQGRVYARLYLSLESLIDSWEDNATFMLAVTGAEAPGEEFPAVEWVMAFDGSDELLRKCQRFLRVGVRSERVSCLSTVFTGSVASTNSSAAVDSFAGT